MPILRASPSAISISATDDKLISSREEIPPFTVRIPVTVKSLPNAKVPSSILVSPYNLILEPEILTLPFVAFILIALVYLKNKIFSN